VVAGRADVTLPPMVNVTDLLNRTSLLELIWLIRQAQFVVSVDSGPMHIAAALTANLLSIHTWSDPAKVGLTARMPGYGKTGRSSNAPRRGIEDGDRCPPARGVGERTAGAKLS
jgi:ADP-heptose:LPS heptosyltransferase